VWEIGVEFNAAVGFELGALLAPELIGLPDSGTPNVSSERAGLDGVAAPFSLALVAARLLAGPGESSPLAGKGLPSIPGVVTVGLPTATQSMPRIVASLRIATTPGIAAAGARPDEPDGARDSLATGTAMRRLGSELHHASTPLGTSLRLIDADLHTAPVDLTRLAPPATTPRPIAIAEAIDEAIDAQTPAELDPPSVATPRRRHIDAPLALGTRNADPAQATPRSQSLVVEVPPAKTEAGTSIAATVALALETADFRGHVAPAESSERGTAIEPGVVTIATATPASESSSASRIAQLPPTADVPVPAGPDLPETIAERLQLYVDHQIGHARIKLNPPELGALDVKITMADDRAYVHIVASHAGARDALEAALPKLRALLESTGLELGGADIGAEPGGRDTVYETPRAPTVTTDAPPRESQEPKASGARPSPGDNTIDLFV
jgi:hypothetical protein